MHLAVDANGQVDPPQRCVVFSRGSTGVQEALLGGTEFATAQTLNLNNGVTNAGSPVGHHLRDGMVAGLGESAPQIDGGCVAELMALEVDVQTLAEIGLTDEVSNGSDDGGTFINKKLELESKMCKK